MTSDKDKATTRYVDVANILRTFDGKRDKPRVVIEDWWKDTDTFAPIAVLRGIIGAGHPYIMEGDIVRTSAIVSMNDYYAETMNSVYILGRRKYVN